MAFAQIGPYELVRPLGAGGMAETFLALRRGPAGFEQRVCLKRILPGRAADPRFVELFLDEARLAAKLRHGCIVQVYDFGEADGSYYLALELVDGVDLEVLLANLRTRGDRLDLPMALHIAGQVLAALHYAHDLTVDGEPLGLVHRDISPSNVMISHLGEVKLTDFGIAKARGRQHRTATGHTKGKIAYMSPEQVRGEALDRRSDLFAMGVVLYEMITGVHPFDAETDLTLLNNIVAGKRPPMDPLVPGLPAEVVALVDALLQPDRGLRLASAADVLSRLPTLENPFSVQSRLSTLVTSVRPQGSLAAGSGERLASDGGTEVLPGASLPPVASAAAKDTTGSGQLPGFERPAPAPRRWLWAGGIAGLALAATLLAIGLWPRAPTSGADPSSGTPSAVPTPMQRTAAGGAAPQPADRVQEPTPSQAPEASRPMLSETTGRGPRDAAVDPADAAPIILGTPATESSRPAAARDRPRPHRPRPKPSRPQGEAAKSPKKAWPASHPGGAAVPESADGTSPARSGADVSIDDF